MQIDSEVFKLVEQFILPDGLSFGQTLAPVMYIAEYKNGNWSEGCLKPYAPLTIDPAAKVLHYAVEAFEGLKAYKVNQHRPHLFRPRMNWNRMNRALNRLCAPSLTLDTFLEGVNSVTACCASIIPSQPGQSLYLRPYLIATEPHLSSLVISGEYSYIVIASPVDKYQSGSMRVLIERESTRAAPGGTGSVKLGGNYAASLASNRNAVNLGFTTSLWLDATERKYIEELSAMNFFVVIDGCLQTPLLTDSILPGVTRDSLIHLARHLGYEVFERALAIDEVITAIREGSASEAFACGTAVILLPIQCLVEADGTTYTLTDSAGPIAQRLRSALLEIQEGHKPDPFGWTCEVPELSRH